MGYYFLKFTKGTDIKMNYDFLNCEWSFKKLFLVISLLRLITVHINQSSFVPDEYWQSLEVAHKIVFGYGYTTWEWIHGIRSFFYPIWFAGAYKIVKTLGIDSRSVVINLPRYMQAIFSSFGDVSFVLWIRNMLGASDKVLASWMSLMWMMCLFISYCSTRTLSNTMELNFTTIALYFYPWPVLDKKGRVKSEVVYEMNKSKRYLWFVGLACLFRPTSVILWLPLALYEILTKTKPVSHFIKVYLMTVLEVCALTILIDTLFYKKIIFTPLNFFLYNFSHNIGIHYGAHSFLWYLTVGIPIVLGPLALPFYQEMFHMTFSTLMALYSRYWKHNTNKLNVKVTDSILFFTVIWTLLCYSSVPHKEFRFITPLVPIMFYIIALRFRTISGKKLIKFISKSRYVTILSFLMFLCNYTGLIYLGRWHQIGPLDVVSALAEEANLNLGKSNFLFLMPCHSTPLYSHLHINVTTRILTCEPNFKGDPLYKDEAEVFFEYPSGWLSKNYPSIDDCHLPSHIIMFSNLKLWVDDFLSRYRYELWKIVFHAHFTQGRQSKTIEIYKLKWIKPKYCFPSILNDFLSPDLQSQ